MNSALELAYFAGYALLFVTVVVSIHAVWRRRDLHRVNILFVVASLIASPFVSRTGALFWALRIGLRLAQPYFLMRLVRHFREVPSVLRAVAVAAIPIGTIVLVAVPVNGPGLLTSGALLYCAAAEIAVAVALIREVNRTAGVTAKRLVFAAIAVSLIAGTNLLAGLSPFSKVVAYAYWLTTLLIAGIGSCSYFAFATPRFLRTRWQRFEQARYLSETANRVPEERGRLAGADLYQATARSVGHSGIVVAIRADPWQDDLVVIKATIPSLLGARVVPGDGLVGRALRSSTELADHTGACERELAERLTSLGAEVLVAPISTPTHAWGVVVVVQRRGSLFPEDDLRLLAQISRYAGTALDHARLVVEARERERRAAERRLREIESRMSLMLDSIKDYAMFVLDQRGRVATWQVGAEHVFGYTSEEMTDEPAATLFEMPADEFDAMLVEARHLGHAEREGTCRRRDGARFIGATTIRTLEVEADDPPGFVAVTRDVTEQRNLQARLQQSQKMEAIGQLAGGIAHDFNNLLTGILGYADGLERELAGDPEKQEEIGEIQRAAERAAGLTRQLLAFSRYQMSRPTGVNLSRLVTNIVPMLRRLIGEQIVVVEETTPDLSAVLGDQTQLEQVVLNLALNARDAMPRGGTLTIRTALASIDATFAPGELAPGRHVLLEVTDTGLGMDAATLARIFEPFFTTKEFGGTGLGLATVYGIVKQMGGTIRVDSEPNRGAIFRLYFPETHVREADKVEPVVADVPLGHETVLIVEDDDVVRTFLRRSLERQGYRVLVAEHPAAALTLAERHRDHLHLVITDVVLPGTTGLELVRQLLLIQPGVPALYISGYADAVLAREGTRPKASHFLQKPFSAADLLKRIRQILSAG
jgi:PAS domain S-box-containing protein